MAGFRKGHLAPMAMGRVAIAMPNMPVRSQRAMIEKVMRAVLPDETAQLIFTLALRTTSAHLGTSLRTNAWNSAGPIPEMSVPIATMRARRSAVLRALRISACSLAITGWGVPAGAKTPNQTLASYPGTPASATVGTSGRIALRFAGVTA